MSEMTMFDVRIKTANGYDTVKVFAKDRDAVPDLVSVSGRILSINPAKKPIFGKALTREERITFLGRLSLMTSSGVSAGRSLDLISKKFTGRIGRVAHSIKARIDDGSDIVQAMKSMPEHFPPSTLSLIESGVHGGSFSKAIDSAVNFENEMEEVESNSAKGFLIAIIQFVFASSLIIVIATLLAPWMLDSDIMKSTDEVNIDGVVLISEILSVILGTTTFLMFVLFMITKVFKPLFPSFADDLTVRIPGFSDLVLSKTYYSTFYGLSVLIKSGIRLKDAFQLTSQSTPDGVIKSDIDRAVQAIEDGGNWAAEMEHLDDIDRACLETSQDRLDVAHSFSQVAKSHRDRYGDMVKRSVNWLDGLSTGLMAVAGFLIFYIMVMPSVQLMGAL